MSDPKKNARPAKTGTAGNPTFDTVSTASPRAAF